jgi:hypothetical protein
VIGGPVEEDTVTVAQLAGMLRVCKITVYRRLDSGEYKGEKVNGKWEIPVSQFPGSVQKGLESAQQTRRPRNTAPRQRRITARNPAPAPGPDDLIPTGEAAAILGGVHPKTVRRAEQKWNLEVRHTEGGHRRYRRGQITALAAQLREPG